MTLPYIDPIIFSLGPFALRWYSLAWLLGGLYVLLQMKATAKHSGMMTTNHAEDLVIWAFLGCMVGGRLGYVLFYGWEQLMADPLWAFKVWEGGMSFHGGAIVAIFFTAYWAKRKQYKFLDCLDMAAPHIPVALGLVRIANFVNQELWGRATSLPWGVIFPSDPEQLARHPSQLYEAFGEGLILWVILYYTAKFKASFGAGLLTGTSLIGYAVMRFLIEFVREPDSHLGLGWLDLTRGQWLSLPLIVLGGYLLWRAFRTKPLR